MTDFETDIDAFQRIRDALKPISQTPIDTGMPRDMWLSINGVEYHVEISRSIARINDTPPTNTPQ